MDFEAEAEAEAEAAVDQIAPSGLMSTMQAAEYLRIKPATLTNWRCTKRRKLTYVKIGGQVRYLKSDLDEFIVANTKTPA